MAENEAGGNVFKGTGRQWRADDDTGAAPLESRRQRGRPESHLVLPGNRPARPVTAVGPGLRYRRLRIALPPLSPAGSGPLAAAGMAAVGAACRYGRDFRPSGTMGRGPSMYEMEGPRPVSRRRPADFSASFAPVDHLPGQQPDQCPGRPDHQLARDSPRRVAREIPFAADLRVSPKAKRLQAIPAPWLRAFFSSRDPGFPPRPGGSKSSPCRGGSELSSRHMTRGFPSAAWLKVFPLPGGSGVAPLTGWRRASPWPEAAKLPFAGWPGVSPAPGGSEFPLRRWRRVSPGPKARSCPLPGGPGFPPRRVARVSPSPVTVPVVGEFLRLSLGPHKRFRPAISRFFGPSTSHPQLTPGCPPRRELLHRTLHRTVHRGRRRRVRGPVSAPRGSGRRT